MAADRLGRFRSLAGGLGAAGGTSQEGGGFGSQLLPSGERFPRDHSDPWGIRRPQSPSSSTAAVAESQAPSGAAALGHVVVLPASHLLTSSLPHLLPQDGKILGLSGQR